MIVIDKIVLGRIKARAEYIQDYAYDDSVKVVAELIAKEVDLAIKEDADTWKELRREHYGPSSRS